MKIIESKRFRYAFYFLIALSAAIFRGLDNQDELWNYNFASCIANGLLPYRDFNMLQTPFSSLVNGIALFIFGHHLFVIRMMGVLLFTGIAVNADKIVRGLGKSSVVAMIIPAMFICMFYWNVFLEYSCFIIFCVYYSMRCDLDVVGGKVLSAKSQVIVGVLLGCAMMSKQTTGTFIAICSWICCVVAIKLSGENNKRALMGMFFRMLGTSLPCFTFLFYLLGTGTFGDFWDMCYKGIFTFSSKYAYITYMKENPAYFIGGLLLPILMVGGVVSAIVLRKDLKGKKALIVLIYSIFSWINIIPLANSFHVCVTAMTVSYLAFFILPDKFVASKLFRAVAFFATFGVMIFLLVVNPIMIIYEKDMVHNIDGLELTFAEEEELEEITTLVSYIDEQNGMGKTVYILDNFAPLFFMPSNQYHKYLDMFLNGNIGTITATEVLENTEEGSIFLLPDTSRKNFQMPREEEEAYMKTLTNAGRICDFTIYMK